MDGYEPAVLEQDGLEAVNAVRKRVDDGDGLQPLWERHDGKDSTGRKKQQRVQNPKHGARDERVIEAYLGRKGEADAS